MESPGHVEILNDTDAPAKSLGPTAMQQGFWRSVFLHALILLIYGIIGVVGKLQGWDTSASKTNAMPFRSAIRVDIVDLPSLKASDLSKIDLSEDLNKAASTRAPEEPVPKASDSAMVDKTKVNDANPNRIKELQARLRADQKRQDLVAKLKQGKPESANPGGRPALAGNIVSEGYSLTGDVASDMDVYNGKARAHIQKFWELPAWMSASNLKARVIVKVAPDGRILSQEFSLRSGNAEFDAYVEQALRAADPLPAPPETLRKIYVEEGIGWSFPK